MNRLSKTFRGRHRGDDGSVTVVLASITSPKRAKGQQDWSCIVHCPFLFEADKTIVGVDADQALELAEAFLRDMLDHRGVEIEKV